MAARGLDGLPRAPSVLGGAQPRAGPSLGSDHHPGLAEAACPKGPAGRRATGPSWVVTWSVAARWLLAQSRAGQKWRFLASRERSMTATTVATDDSTGSFQRRGSNERFGGLSPRGWQGIAALLVWLAIGEVVTVGVIRFSLPDWFIPLEPIPSLILVTNALGPRPWGERVQVRISGGGQRLVLLAVALLGAAQLCLAFTSTQFLTDQPLTITCAARSLLHGDNPYTLYEPQCAADLDSTSGYLTALKSGPFAGFRQPPPPALMRRVEVRDQRDGTTAGFPPYGYPPDATLLVLPVAFQGWTAIWIWVMVVCLALMATAWWGNRPRGWQTLLAWQVFALGTLSYTFSLGWDPELISYLLLALAFARLPQRRVSAVAMAAALCTNQLTWVVLPVYLAIVVREPGFRERLCWLAGAAVVGVVPWWIWDHALFSELLHFLTLPYFPEGSSLAIAFPLTTPWSHLYMVAPVLALLVCAVVALRYPRWRWAMAVAVWGSLIVSTRGFDYYLAAAFWLGPVVLLGAWRLSGIAGSPGGPVAVLPGAAGRT